MLIGLIIGTVAAKKRAEERGIEFNLISSVHLFEVARSENKEKLSRELGFLVYSWFSEYTNRGIVTTDARINATISRAREIAAQVGTNVVMVNDFKSLVPGPGK